jgi:hypothetical protein
MDRGRYQELINGGLQVSGFNRRYLVAPMDRGSKTPEISTNCLEGFDCGFRLDVVREPWKFGMASQSAK